MSLLTIIPGRLLAELAIGGILAGSLYFCFGEWQSARIDLAEYKAEVSTMAADQARQVKEREQRAEAHNEQVLQSLQADLDGSSARADLLNRRLLSALTDASAMSKAADISPVVIACGVPASNPEIERLISEVRSRQGDVFAACDRDGKRLNGLIEQIAPQM